MNCPDCGGKLNGAGSSYRCGECGVRWKVLFSCEVCGSTPVQVESCGSVSFFCENCKTARSRESMNKKFEKL